ncbi:unnamed protein product, partial [marine sediment metagenome]
MEVFENHFEPGFRILDDERFVTEVARVDRRRVHQDRAKKGSCVEHEAGLLMLVLDDDPVSSG